MGLREKVTITLVIIALTQIACRHCMPRTPRKASLKRYLNDLKPVKNNPVPTPYSPSRVNKKPKHTFGKAAQNGRISQNSLPNKSLYKTYNFPENEYPLDNSPRDPFHIGMNFNENNRVNTLQKARNLQSLAISDLKKEIKMKRKLLSNKQVKNYGNSQLKTDMSSIKSVSNPDPTRLHDSKIFPEVQYPLNTIDTWGPNYWNYLPSTQEKPFHRCGQQTFNPKAKEDINKPLTRLTKAKASKYLQSYDKLKEEHRRTSTENSKRSNVGQKGLNFTKTATCEKVSDDFMTAGLVSNIPSNSTEMKNELISSAKITTGSENTCPVTEYPYHPMPMPYKVIEENTENICPAHEPKNNTKELQDVDNSVIAQTLQLIQEILFNDDTSLTVSTGNFSKEIEKNMNTSDYTVVSTKEDLSTTLMDSAKNCTVSPTEELSHEISDDALVCNLRNNMTSLPAELIPENTTTVAGPLNVRMSIPFSEPITYEAALTNSLNPGPTPLSIGNAVPGPTSIIIIPFNNNAVGNSEMFGTSPDTPIIVYLPSTQSSDNPSQPWPFNQIVSSSIDRPVPNNQLYNVLSNMAPLQNDNHFSTALASELLNSNSDSGSSLPIHETLPTNSMSNNNESSPSSMKEKPISDILIDKSLIDDALFVNTTNDEKLSELPTKTGDLEVNTDTLPPISDFEHPLFDFSGSDFTSLSHGPYNNILHNELPIIAREIDSDHQILNVSSKDLFIPIQNVTSEHLHKITSMNSVSEDSLSEIPNEVQPVALVTNFSSVTPTDSIEILKTNTFLLESIPSLPMDALTESLPQPIDQILLSTPLIEPPTAKLLQPKESSPSPTLLSETLSDKFPIIMDTKLPLTPVSDTTSDSTPQHIGWSSSPPILNSSPMMTDMTLKIELYKMRQILDKMLSTETPTYNQLPPIDSILLPISASDSLLPIKDTPTETLPVPAVDKTLLPLPITDSPIDRLQQVHETLSPISVDDTLTDTLPLPGNKLITPNILLETDTPSLSIDETVPPTLVSESSADNKPYVLDNLVTPLSETVTLRTKDTPDNGLSHKIDDMPLKMDLKFSNIYEVSSDDLSLLFDNIPAKVHSEHTTNPGVSTYEILTQVVETLTPVSEVLVSDLPKPTNVLSLPVDEVLEGASPNVLTDSVKTLQSGSIDKLLQDSSSSKVPSDGLPALPMNVFRKLSIHETFPDSQLNEISSEGPPQKDHLPQSVQKLIPDLSLALTNDPPLKKYSPSLVIDKNIEFPYSTTFHTDTNDLPLVVEHLLSPKNDITVDSLVTDISNAVSLSTNLEVQQFTNLDKTSDEVVSESTPSDLPRDNLPLPEEKILSLTDNKLNDLSLPINKTPSTSKLPINKAFLENVLSDITKGGLSSVVAKALPVTPHSLLDKTLHHVDIKSPLSETKDIPVQPVEKIFLNSEHTDNLTEYVLFSKKLEDTSITDFPSELPLLPMDEMHKDKPYIPTNDIEDRDKHETQPLDNPTHDLPVPIDKVSLLKDTTKTPSSSKLPITKALLKNVLSDITTRGISVPVAQSLLVTSPSVLDKTLYYVESPISHITEDSPLLPVEKTLPSTSHSDHTTDNLPMSTKDTLPLPIDKTYSESQSLNIPTELTSPIDNKRPDIPIISMYDKEKDEIKNQSSENLTDDLSSISPMEGITSLSKDTPSDLPLPNNKIPSSSKLPITKVLLENVLSDINTRGFSVPVAQSLLVTSPSVLEKTLYHVESPISHITKDSPSQSVEKILPNTLLSDHPTNNLPISTENTLPLPIDKTYSKLKSLNTPTELTSPIDNIRTDIPIISMYDKEKDEIKNPSSENLADDLSSASPMEGIISLSKATPSDLTLPNNKIPSSSKLPITKVLLENVLSNINTRGFSVPVAQSLLVTSPSVLEKTLYHVKSPISHITKNSPSQSVEKILPNTLLSDHPTNNLLISTEDTLLLPIDKTYSELQSLNDPTELTLPIDNIRPDIPNISMYDKEQNEIKNRSSENLTDGFSSALPMEGIISFSKDMLSDLTLTNDKTPSSSKLPITKALLENVLSDINTRGLSLPAAKALPVAPRSQLDKTLYFLESPVSDMTEKSSVIPIDNLPPSRINEDVSPQPTDTTLPDKPILDIPTDVLLMNKINNSVILTNDVKATDKSDNLTDDVEHDDEDKSEIWSDDVEAIDKSDSLTDDIQDRDISGNLSDDVDYEDISDTLTDDVEDEDEDKSDNLSDDGEDRDIYDNLTDDIEIEDSNEFFFSNDRIDDILSDLPLPRTKPYLTSRIPITKALLEKVLSDITDGGIHP